MSERSTSSDSSGKRGVTRRGLFRGGGAGAASVVVLGLGVQSAQAAGPRVPAHAPAAPVRRSSLHLKARDPHSFTARTAAARTGLATAAGLTDVEVRVLPLDRAKFLVNSRFDLRVEVTGVDPQTTELTLEVAGPHGPAPILHGDPERTSSAPDSLEVTYRGLHYAHAGSYTVTATAVSNTQTGSSSVGHEVVVARTKDEPARNVIFFLGDGMGQPAITAARILSKGMTEGKYHGLLNMDVMDYRGLVTTSGADSIATDSANSMSAYMTGHKSSVNAMGVYEANDPDPSVHPRVENLAEMLKRSRDMSIGVVSTAEIQDATPAAVWAHTRRRAEYTAIMDQALEPERMPDVLLGGGMATLLPQSHPDSKREDDRDLREEFRDRGFHYVTTRAELQRSMRSNPQHLLGTFHPGNLNVYVDRQHAPDPEVLGEWTDQPGLVEMTRAALSVLESKPNGFFLMVEAASIDKMEHPLDGPRAVYDAIELDQAVGAAVEWAAGRDDTLIVVTADHNHSMSIVGTHDRRKDTEPEREANAVYGDAGFPTYADEDGDGFPDDLDPDVQLFYGWSNHPDHSDDFRFNDTFRQPALEDEDGTAVDNPERDPDALVQIGNLPYEETNCVHTVEDVSIVASGPGAARFNAVLDNTEVFHAVAAALALELPALPEESPSQAQASVSSAIQNPVSVS